MCLCLCLCGHVHMCMDGVSCTVMMRHTPCFASTGMAPHPRSSRPLLWRGPGVLLVPGRNVCPQSPRKRCGLVRCFGEVCAQTGTDADRHRHPTDTPPPHARKLAGAFAASFLSWSPEGDALAISGSKVRARAGDVATLGKVDLRSTMNTTYTHTHTHTHTDTHTMHACMHPSAMC